MRMPVISIWESKKWNYDKGWGEFIGEKNRLQARAHLHESCIMKHSQNKNKNKKLRSTFKRSSSGRKQPVLVKAFKDCSTAYGLINDTNTCLKMPFQSKPIKHMSERTRSLRRIQVQVTSSIYGSHFCTQGPASATGTTITT